MSCNPIHLHVCMMYCKDIHAYNDVAWHCVTPLMITPHVPDGPLEQSSQGKLVSIRSCKAKFAVSSSGLLKARPHGVYGGPGVRLATSELFPRNCPLLNHASICPSSCKRKGIKWKSRMHCTSSLPPSSLFHG